MDEKGHRAGSRLNLVRHDAELAPRASGARFQAMADESPVILWETDANGDNKFANQTFCDFFGVTFEDVEGKEWQPLLHPEDAHSHLEQFFKAVREHAAFSNEARHRRKDGEWRWLAVQARPRCAPTGEFLGHVGVCVDITERRQAEEALRESEERFRSVFESAAVGIGRVALDGRFLEVNEAYARIVGYTREELLDRRFQDITYPEDLETDVNLLAALLEGRRRAYHLEKRYVRKDRELVWVSLSVGLSLDGSGRPAYCSVVVEDITARKRAEAALRDSEERLRASEAALREADRQKDQFLAMLSHELRNPLAPIRHSLYLLDHAAPGGEQATRAKAILHRQVGQLTWLIDDLLDVTRITHGKVQLQRERLDVNELAHRAVEDHRTGFVKGEVRLELFPAPAEVWVNCDRVRLTQIIGNLLQNAAKFTPRGGRATVSVESYPARGQAILTVRDTGSGIAPDMLPRLFQAFTQADTTLDRSKGGLGLGLALVKGLVELHGGSVSASSEGLGKGAAFTIRLPLDATAAHAQAQLGAHRAAVQRRVLVVEDNVDAAVCLRDVLELEEHFVEVAYGGREGIEKARAFHPDVVLCDIGLPEMDGYAVARALRADPELAHVGLVAVSGYTQPDDVAIATEAGFDAHLAKPPSVEKLKLAVEEAGERRRRRAGASAPMR